MYFAFVCVCRYKNNGYVENTEKLVIHNNSGLETEVQFHFQYDTQASTYLLDPPSMTLQPDEKQVFVVLRFFRTSTMKLDAVNKMIFFFFADPVGVDDMGVSNTSGTSERQCAVLCQGQS